MNYTTPLLVTLCMATTHIQPESDPRISLSQFMSIESLSHKPFVKNPQRLTIKQENDLLKSLYDWTIQRFGAHRLCRTFTIRQKYSLPAFIDIVTNMAYDNDLYLEYIVIGRNVHIEIYSPEFGGLTVNDFILASRISTLQTLHYRP